MKKMITPQILKSIHRAVLERLNPIRAVVSIPQAEASVRNAW